MIFYNLKPLVEIYDELGGKVFLEFCLKCCDINLCGILICWAFNFSKNDISTLLKNVEEGNLTMVDEVNQKAEFFECFPENPKVGRLKKVIKLDNLKAKRKENSKLTTEVNQIISATSKDEMKESLIIILFLSFLILILSIASQLFY